MKTNRTRVYVAGPYTSDPRANTEFAIEVGQHLLELGYAPLVPHLTHFWHQRFTNDWQTWMELDLPWVAQADLVVRLPGSSVGADRELEVAAAHGIPIYFWEHDGEHEAYCGDCGAELRALMAEGAGDRRQSPPPPPPPVAKALDTIQTVFTKKNADYAQDANWRSNFADVAAQMGWADLDAVDALIAVKQARLKSLRTNGRTPVNESVADTLLDRAVYAVIALAIYLEDNQ